MTGPPRFPVKLYEAFGCDEAVLGDMCEEFAERSQRFGERRARSWFWSNLVRSAVPLLLTPLARAGVPNVVVAVVLGTSVFYATSLAAWLVVDLVRAATAVPTLLLFAGYLALTCGGGVVAGRCATSRAPGAASSVATLVCAGALAPALLGLLGGSTAGTATTFLWLVGIPVAIGTGARPGQA